MERMYISQTILTHMNTPKDMPIYAHVYIHLSIYISLSLSVRMLETNMIRGQTECSTAIDNICEIGCGVTVTSTSANVAVNTGASTCPEL